MIALLPEEFFRNCAIAIAASLLGLCLVLVLTGRKQKNKKPLSAALYKKIPTLRAWCSHSGSDLPLAGLPIAVRKDHVVQVAQDPIVQHNTITLLSSLAYKGSIARPERDCARDF